MKKILIFIAFLCTIFLISSQYKSLPATQNPEQSAEKEDKLYDLSVTNNGGILSEFTFGILKPMIEARIDKKLEELGVIDAIKNKACKDLCSPEKK